MDMWELPKQKYSSAKSSIKQLPAGFKIVDKYFGWQPDTVNLDVGGGKYDIMTEKLGEKEVINLVFDPYNRNVKHNNKVIAYAMKYGVDTATLFNVLNVIEKKNSQIVLLRLTKNALKEGGWLYVRSMYRNPSGKSGVTKSGTFQHYMTHKDYLEIVKEVFPNAEIKHGLIIATK